MKKMDKYEIIEKYLACSSKCPFCGSDNISGDSIDIVSGEAYQEITCNECENEWMDVYQLVGIHDAYNGGGEALIEDASLDIRAILKAILEAPAVLPVLKGLNPELDDLIERKLKQ